MSNTPTQEKPIQAGSPASGPTQPSRSVQPMTDPSVPKRLCFYKSGDRTFGGHRVVVNARTFKTFDALLDALSKKVPLPFGVRTITTPRGTHLVKGLEDLQDGGSYLCSDQKRVKPLNLEEVNRRQVPWNTPKAYSANQRRRQGLQFSSFGRGDDSSGRPVKVPERMAVRTPRRLVVIKNKDPNVRRTIVLQKRTAPTFDALLDYLSQILQFPVLKLYSIDGRRIGGLAALILCSGFLVAAGNEPYRLSNHSFQRTSQAVQAMFMETGQPSVLQHQVHNHRPASSGRCSRNFSLSSEQYIIKQINKSWKESANSHTRSPELNSTCLGMCGSKTGTRQRDTCVLPQDDDIEKSFRVNQDGSMTVEMKVRLTIKEEETLHWTTTVSRSSLRRRTLCASVTESGNISPDSNIYIAKRPSDIHEDEAKEENQPLANGGEVSFNNEREAKKKFRRAPTPGPHRVKKEASFERVKVLTESGVQGSSLGHYSYLERTTEGDTMEGYCRVRHSSSSQPVPKPRKTVLEGNTSLLKSSGVAEVLKIENDGIEVRETVMRIYESQGCYNNYLANEGADADTSLHRSSPVPQSHQSTASGPYSSSNDIDFSLQQPTADSLQRQKEEMLSLSSEPISPTLQVANSSSSVSKNEAKSEEKPPTPISKKTKTKNSSQSRLMNIKHTRSSADKLNRNANAGKKSLSSTESAKSGPNPKLVHTHASGRRGRESETLLRTSTREKNINKATAKYNGHNVDTPTVRPPMKKNVSDLLKLKKSSRKKTSSKSIAMTDNKLSSSDLAQQSVSKISLNRSPSEIHQYVENWLEDVIPDPVVYMVTADGPEPPTKVLFQIGCDSETEEKKETQIDTEDYCQTPPDTLRAIASCLSIPLWLKEQKTTDVSMPNVEPTHHQACVRSKNSSKSNNESPSSQINILSPKEKLKPVLQELCLSIQSMRMTSDQSSSPIDFSFQVASVFGSSCKAFLSFLSVMALRDGLTGDSTDSENTSEAMLLLKFLQNISAIEDQDKQRASLTDLHSGTSPQFMKSWMDFQTWREELATASLIPKFQDTQDSVWIQGAIVDQLMKELNMPCDLWMEISSTLQQVPEEDCTVVKPERNSSESDDMEQVVQDTDLKQCHDDACIHDNTNDKDDGSSWAGEMVEEPAKQTGCDVKETKVLPVDKGELQVDEGNIKGAEDPIEDSKEAMDEGVMKQKGSKHDAKEAAVFNEEVQEEEPVKKGMANKDTEEKGKVDDKAGNEIIDEHKEAQQDGTDTDLSKGNEGHGVKKDDVSGTEKTTKEKAKDEYVEEEGAREHVERDEEVDKEEKKDNIKDEKDDKDYIDKNVEAEGTEILSDDNSKEGNAYTPEPTTDEEQVDLLERPEELEKNENTQETSPEKYFVEQVKKAGRIKDEAENEDNLGCYQEPNPEVEANELDEGIEKVDNKKQDDEHGIEENMEGTGVLNEVNIEMGNVDIYEHIMGEKIERNLVKQIEKLEEDEKGNQENCPEEESVDKVAGQTQAEVETEDNLGYSLEQNPEVEGTASDPDERKEDDNIEENMGEGGTEVLSEDNKGKGNDDVDIPEPSTDKQQVYLIEQIEGLETDEEDTREMTPEKESVDKVEKPRRIQSKVLESDDNLGCSQEPNPKVQDKVSLPDEGSEEMDKEDSIEDKVRETDDKDNIEENVQEKGTVDNNEKFNDDDVDIPEPTTDKEKVDLEEQEEQEEGEMDTQETSQEEALVDQVGMPVQTLAEAESEGDLGCFQETNTELAGTAHPHDEGIGIIEEVNEKGDDTENEKDKHEIEENTQMEGTEVLSEANNEEGIVAITEHTTDKEHVDLIEQTEKLEEEEEGTCLKESSGEEVEKPSDTPTETENEDDSECFQEPNPEVEGSASVPSEKVEEVVNKKEDNIEDQDREKDDIEENLDNKGDQVLSGDSIEKGYGDAIVDEEQDNLTEQTENLGEDDICSQEDSGKEVEKPNGTPTEAECEDDGVEDLNEGCSQEANAEVEVTASVPIEATSKSPQKASGHHSNTEHGTESPVEYLSDERFEEDIPHENETGISSQDQSNSISHPVEISQELLDFVNSALQSSSLIFTYDNHGNIRIEPDHAQITEIKKTLTPESQRDCTYGLKCLQSPITSDLSDYRPESLESGRYQSQDSMAITSESNEETSERPPEGLTERNNLEWATSKISKGHSEGGSFSSGASLTKGLREALSCCKKVDNDPAPKAEQDPEPSDGVLIDQGRWLLKENHLIRNSPPFSEGMYRDLDSTSEDTGNSSEESQTQTLRQHTLLAAISSSELEELAKPQPPRCSYFTMPHGSDSDPFPDDTSDRSWDKNTHNVKGRGFRVSPVIDTSKTWTNKNGSLSSFASVEFKIADRKVHPEGGESSAGEGARRDSSGRHQSQESTDAMNGSRALP
ncbi:uncharacterized protein LOC144044311 isoform X2 [Vanacampus margaritifer]